MKAFTRLFILALTFQYAFGHGPHHHHGKYTKQELYDAIQNLTEIVDNYHTCNGGKSINGQDLSDYIFEANGHCYYAELSRMSFMEAVENCNALFGIPGHLAEPLSKGENHQLYHAWSNNYFMNGHVGNPGIWIGITDMYSEGTFAYQSTNTTVGFEAWSSGNPDNFNGNENCIEITWGLWNDANCEEKFSSICQF